MMMPGSGTLDTRVLEGIILSRKLEKSRENRAFFEENFRDRTED